MASFHYDISVPNLPLYLFEADLVINIITPQSYTVVPTVDGGVYLRWLKHDHTTDDGFLYSEVSHSTDLETWELLTTLNYPTTVYTDTGLNVGAIYYYRVRFIRTDSNGNTINTSDYTTTLSARIVNALGFEPADSYSNKFFRYLIDSMPGTRVYDHSRGAHFSADNQDWQTTSRFLDGFSVFANGAEVANEPADASALYAKRAVDFPLSNRYTDLVGKELSTGVDGEHIQVNTYLIYTFLMGYAQQFLTLYEKYYQVVADKFVDAPQLYTKGFRPSVTDRKTISVADLYNGFGKQLNLTPLRAQNLSQGVRAYKRMLQQSFTNIADAGKVKAIHSACADVLGITKQTLFEYNKQRWFASNREMKLYVVPSGDPINYTTNASGSDNDLIFTADSDKFNIFVEYKLDRVHPSSGVFPNGWLEVLGSSGETPYTYLFKVHISEGVTTASDITSLFATNPHTSALVSVANSGGDAGTGAIYWDMEAQRLALRSFWVGWENTENVKLNDQTYKLADVASAYESGTDLSTAARMLSANAATTTFDPDDSNAITDEIGEDNMALVRDDNADGTQYLEGGVTKTLTGEIRSLFKISMTTSSMNWVTSAILRLCIRTNTNAGYLRLYRIRKQYDVSEVCWNFRDRESVSGYHFNGSTYASATRNWVVGDWETVGADGDSDAVLLKEFYIPQILDSAPTVLNLDVTDVVQDLYKYEVSRLDMGADPENILQTGFMLTAEGFPDKSVMILASPSDATYPPAILWTKLSYGFTQVDPVSTTYFYVDGTTRYGRLLVLQSDREPIRYVKTVNERIRNHDIRLTSDLTISLGAAVPAAFVVGERVYGVTSGAIGKISSTGDTTVFVDVEENMFVSGETLRLLSTPASTAVIDSVSYSGNKYVKLSRTPTSTSRISVNHTGAITTPAVPPSTYPDYAQWTEAGPGIEPVFLENTTGVTNVFASRDEENTDIIHLNTIVALASIGDVVVTYQYEYDFVLLGRAVADNQGVTALEACSRLNSHLFVMSDNDQKYKSELMLPEPSSGELVEISGSPSVDEYSDYNLGVLCDAIANIRRYNGEVEVFKYDPVTKAFRVNQQYHQFLRKA